QHHHGTLPTALAIDGKWVRDSVLTVCLSDHETGAPVAIGIADNLPKTDDNKREGEQTVAHRLYDQIHLKDVTITGDANFCNRPQSEAMHKNGASKVLQLKDPNRNSHKRAVQKAAAPPFLSTPRNPSAATDVSMNEP